MAHMIEDEMISWKGERPWHGLGVEVPAYATGAEMLKLAKMDWTVEQRSIAMFSGDSRKLLRDPLAGFKAIVRTDTDAVFQVATPKYEPFQNAEVVDFFREYCEAGHATMETVGALRGGAVVWALAKLTGGDFDLGDRFDAEDTDDKLKGYMLLATSHDGSLRTIGRATQVRVVCWNTLSAALRGVAGSDKRGARPVDGTFQMMHTRKMTPAVAAEARRVMGLAAEQVERANSLANQLAAVTVDEKGWMEFMSKLLGENNVLSPKTAALSPMASGIKDATLFSPGAWLPTAKGTLWGAVNGVTYYADHQRGRAQDTRLFSAWFGDSDRLKRSAVSAALELAGIGA